MFFLPVDFVLLGEKFVKQTSNCCGLMLTITKYYVGDNDKIRQSVVRRFSKFICYHVGCSVCWSVCLMFSILLDNNWMTRWSMEDHLAVGWYVCWSVYDQMTVCSMGDQLMVRL